MDSENKSRIAGDVEAVVTSFNQGKMLLEAVWSLCGQTVLPDRIIIVDDGSTEENSVRILKDIESVSESPVPVTVIRQQNAGVSAARNTGICCTQSPMVVVLDGDDKLEAAFIEQVGGLLREDSSMCGASSWMHTFGVLDAAVHPTGGGIAEFLIRNCCPATHILRREVWEKCGGYDEAMRAGFEDWDFFLRMLETMPGAHIGIVPRPLLQYRTAAASANITSMSKRLELMRYIIGKHVRSYQDHIADVILGMESISMSRLYGWENEISHSLEAEHSLSKEAEDFIKSPSYGDGGMAAAVRIASAHKV